MATTRHVSDYTLAPSNTVIVGMIGSGKSTFAYRHLLNTPAACRFIFDDLGRAAVRLRVRPCFTAPELEAALPGRWVIFNPHRMFPGDTKAAFKYFCDWAYNASARGPGKKLFLVDEVWQWQDNQQMPRELAKVVQTGREENIEFVCATQLPHKVHAAIVGQATELVCFRIQERLALATLRDLGADADAVSNLPMVIEGKATVKTDFISYDRLSGGKLRAGWDFPGGPFVLRPL